MRLNDLYEFDKASGHLFCKYCGNNYLTNEHKDNCESLKEQKVKIDWSQFGDADDLTDEEREKCD